MFVLYVQRKNIDVERREREERRKWRKRGSILRRQRLASPTAQMVVTLTTRPVQKIRLRDELLRQRFGLTRSTGWEEGERRERNERERVARTNRR